MVMKKIVQNHEGCIGCGTCAAICPEFWEMNDEGKADLKGAKISPDKKEQELEIEDKDMGCNKDAAEACPVQVIHIS